MFTCNTRKRLLTRVLAGLTIGVTVVMGALLHAAANSHAYL